MFLLSKLDDVIYRNITYGVFYFSIKSGVVIPFVGKSVIRIFIPWEISIQIQILFFNDILLVRISKIIIDIAYNKNLS